MSFSSLLFLLGLLPITVLAYWALPRRAGAQNTVLLLASLLFFASWGPALVPVLLAAIGVNYGLLSALRARNASSSPQRAGLVLALGLTYNLGQLLLFKYLGFFASTASALATLLGGSISLPTLHWLVPVGLSFWTLQILAHLIDVAYGRRTPPAHWLDYAVFVSFFPQTLSGPISRGDLLDQLGAPRQPLAADFARGGFAFLLGYVMKFLVAGTLAGLADPVFADGSSYNRSAHWLALFAYTSQVFCDFAGYSLMAQGLAALFGLHLIDNFRFPFLALNISEFWKRWHISLTQLLFDYIYTPLVTGDGWMRGRLATGLFVVLLVSGLWHGATWMFVIWGALHGLALMLAHRWDGFYRGLCRQNRVWVQRRKSRAYVLTGWALTQTWFLLSLIPFRSPTLDAALGFAKGLLVSSGGEALAIGGSIAGKLNGLVCLLFVVIYHLAGTASGQRGVAYWQGVPAWGRGVCYGLVIVYLFLFKPLSEGAFLYAQF